MKILAKTTGATLMGSSEGYIDCNELRLIDYDSQVRGWNNRNLLVIECFVPDEVTKEELVTLGEKDFIKKYSEKKSEVKEESKEEVKKEERKRSNRK